MTPPMMLTICKQDELICRRFFKGACQQNKPVLLIFYLSNKGGRRRIINRKLDVRFNWSKLAKIRFHNGMN